MYAYQQVHPQLTICGMSVYELLEGFYRGGDSAGLARFYSSTLPTCEVIEADIRVHDKAAEIQATLRRLRQTIDVTDSFVAATAITHGLTLVNANTRHFPRVVSAGFPLVLANWRNP